MRRLDPALRACDEHRDGLACWLYEQLVDAPPGSFLAAWLAYRLDEIARMNALERERMELLQHELDVS